MSYVKCDKCGHQWHGLHCAVMDYGAGLCACVGAFEDDYWKGEG